MSTDSQALLTQIQQAIGFSLTLVENIDAYLRDHYPASYRAVVTPEAEMTHSRHTGTVFADHGGAVIGLNLYGLDLTDEQIDRLLALDLPQLRALNLAKTPLTRFVLPATMPALRRVDLHGCEQLQRLRCEDGLIHLQWLDAAGGALTQFRVPASYTGLQFLRLDGNQSLAEFRFDGPCPLLEVLMLRGCKLKAFHLPAGFDQLVHLYLNQNALEELELVGELKELRTLQVRKNELAEVSGSLLQAAPKLEALYLGENPLLQMEVLRAEIEGKEQQDHLPLVQRYFRQMAIGTPQINNECKVLLIGNGKAGKTQIVNKLSGKPFEKEWNSTHGISLTQLPMPPFSLNLWDFGGQDMYHNTHRLFLQQNAVYLLAWCRETEEHPTTIHPIEDEDGVVEDKEYINQKLPYWLDYAYSLGKDSPMIAVQTHLERDKRIEKPEIEARYRKRFSFLHFHQVDSKVENRYDSGYEQLETLIFQAVDRIKKGERIPEPYFVMRKWLRAQTEAGIKTLDFVSYEQKALEWKIESPRELLEGWLFKSGVVYYRRGRFQDQIILNQDWAINAIYVLFDRRRRIPWEIAQQGGYFTGELVRKVWTKEKYPEEEHELFIDFMKSCDLCFEVEVADENGSRQKSFGERLFIAPQLLMPQKPALLQAYWSQQEVRYLRYQHDFLHEGVIQSFIAQTAYLTRPEALWRYGIHLIEQEAHFPRQEATIEAEEGYSILVRFTSQSGRLLAKIHQLLTRLQDTPGTLTYSQDGQHYQPLPAQIQGESGWLSLFGKMPVAGLDIDMDADPETKMASKQAEPGFALLRSLEVEEEHFLALLQAHRETANKLETIQQQLATQPPGALPASPKKKILFLAANPLNTGRLQLDFETKEFKTELALGPAKDQFELLYELALDKSSFLRIKGKQPFILHFSGHGDKTGICIQDGQNQIKMIPNEILGPFFKSLSGITELVLLNSCLSSVQAAIIAEFIPYVVGTKEKILDPLAIAFSSGLYNGLSEGLGFREAIELGRWSVGIEDAAAMESYEAWENGIKIVW